ncbi:c-type cytochrome [Roseivivax sp. CAU 1753]
MPWFRPLLVVLTCLSGPVAAQDGERLFRRCAACHSVVTPEGQTLVFGGRVGPNLYGVAGRPAGTQPGFNYSASMRSARDLGLVWSEAEFVAYLHNPTEYLKTYLGDPTARARMAFRLDSGGDAVYRYLQSLER